MRKFIFSTTVLGAIVSGWGTVQRTRTGPRDWRLILMWISWGLAIATAIGAVLEEAKAASLED